MGNEAEKTLAANKAEKTLAANEAEKTLAANEAEKTQKVPETNAKSNKRDQEDRLESCTEMAICGPS